MIYSRPTKMSDALRHVTAKRVLPLAFSSAEIEEYLPNQIAAHAMFSARTTYAGYLQQTQGLIGRVVQPAVIRNDDGTLRRAEKGESVSPARVRTLMQQQLRELGYQPTGGQEGGLKDLSSDRRTALVINMQTSMARGYARNRAVQSHAILATFPADQLYRAISRNEKRNWARRWNDARRGLGSLTQATVASDDDYGPFIAPKNDPIWSAISRFGNPYPPFDYQSGMRVHSVLASEARQHGITEPPQPVADPLDVDISAPIRPSTPPAMLDAVMQSFPGAVATDRRIYWIPDPDAAAGAVLAAADTGKRMRTSIAFLDADTRAAVSTAIGQEIPEHAAVALDSRRVAEMLAQSNIDTDDIKHVGAMVGASPRISSVSPDVARQLPAGVGVPVQARMARDGNAYDCMLDYSQWRDRPQLRLYDMRRIEP